MTNQKTYDLKKTLTYSFTAIIIFLIGIYLVSLTLGRFQSTLLPDQGASWYYWKLPSFHLWATITAWALYVCHQLAVWYLIYKLKKQERPSKDKIGPINRQLLIVNGMFIILHLLQTAIFYDGLAQTVPVMSSQGSVIVMLVLVLIMMNGRRGLFFGKKVKLPSNSVQGVQKVHSYYIAWAIIYTFWFHPTEGTVGHLIGFLYLFLLMLQMSLGRTSFHTKIKWITLLEVYVAIHGAIVAIEAGNGMWPMFAFGFMMMFIVTEMYGIISSKTALLGLSVLYIGMSVFVYSGVLGNNSTLVGIHQITWIPIILYGLVFVFAWIIGFVFNLLKKHNRIEKKSV